jgi:hypothetical protein
MMMLQALLKPGLTHKTLCLPLKDIPDCEDGDESSEAIGSSQVLICGFNWVVLKKTEAILDPSIFCNLRSAHTSALITASTSVQLSPKMWYSRI